MGIDGSDIRIPTTEENYEYFGFKKRKGHDSNNEPSMASISCLYDCMNNFMKLEEFSGYLKDIIKQDIYISNILYNLISAIIIENANINQEKYMYQMHINRNYSTGIIKTLFIKILLSSGKEKEKLEEILYDEIDKNVVPIRKKSNPRKRNIKNKCSMSYKNSY